MTGSSLLFPTLTPEGARLVVILHGAWRSFPLMILIAAGMAMIPEQLYETARVDVANAWQQFTSNKSRFTGCPCGLAGVYHGMGD